MLQTAMVDDNVEVEALVTDQSLAEAVAFQASTKVYYFDFNLVIDDSYIKIGRVPINLTEAQVCQLSAAYIHVF